MKLLYYLPIVLSMLPLGAFAKGDVAGLVINKDSGDPMDFVTIKILDASGKPTALGTVTDADGRFVISGLPDGKYTLVVSNVGSIDQDRPLTVSGADVNLGTIRLADDAKLLKEVVVEGVRSQMRFELDKKVFQVDADIASAGQSASELLESIPSVEVDQDGEVSLRGNSSVTVWINGKDSGLTSDNRAQILEQIPGESIDRIEVITNPSAKYSPEGTAGIINIILKRDRRGGYFGSAEIGGNSRGGGNVSANINWNAGKWDTFASVGFRMRHNKGGSIMRRTFDDGTYTYGDGDSRNHGNNIFVRLGATYHLTDNDEFYLNGFGMFGHRWGRTGTSYTSTLPNMWSSDYQLSRNRGDNRGAHGEFGYTHRFSENHTIDAMVSYNHWGGPSWNSYLESPEWSEESGVTEEDSYREQEMPISVNSWEAKLDYSKTFSQYLKLEAGYNGNYSHENTPNTTKEGTSKEDMKLREDLYNRFIYNNNISALYFTLGGKVGNFSYSGGLRAEAWQVRAWSLAYGQSKGDVDEFKANKFALFPSVYLSYALPRDNELQINYTRRIRRPWGGQLNSFHDISDPTAISYGNPQLQPEYSNSFELNYLKSWTYHMISVSAYLRTASDVMNRLSFMNGDVMNTTWANVSDRRNAGVEIVGKNQLFKGWLDLTTTVNLYDNFISGWKYKMLLSSGDYAELSGKRKSSFAWDVRMMANVKLPWKLSFQATGRYNSKRNEAQSTREAGWRVDLGLRKVFGDWSISLNVRDLFDSRRFKSTTYGPGYEQYSERWRGGRTFRLTVKYSFGNMKAKRNKNNMAPIDEDASGYSSGEME